MLELERLFATVTLPLQAGVRVHAACRTERELHKFSNYSGIRCGPLKHPDIQRPKTKAGRMPTASHVQGDIYALPPMAKGLHGSDCTTGRDRLHQVLGQQMWIDAFILDHQGMN